MGHASRIMLPSGSESGYSIGDSPAPSPREGPNSSIAPGLVSFSSLELVWIASAPLSPRYSTLGIMTGLKETLAIDISNRIALTGPSIDTNTSFREPREE
ncbi:uncharacterized protein AKAW2_80447S [Aspergillus luchuensis]|nr:uncharacterized protein AKAW2_80447S [Aspergillus luchuensis]BCS04646.1 hypothetical protein AKAW2_80447S [Aspergillus luchuensis]BCS16220.1 hypothetical protein ALUC_80427S [Aspergillus luchuensis]